MVRFTKSSAVQAALRDPDVHLMLQVRAGNQAAFEELYARYRSRVHAVIGHLMGHHRSSYDLTQEVFLRMYRARASYVAGAKFSTWLFTIVNNVVANARRSLGRRREVSLDGADGQGDHPLDGVAYRVNGHRVMTPPLDAERRELRGIVQHGMSQLADRQRTAVSLCDFDGLSYSGVAEAMGTSADAAKSLIHRGRANLRRILEPRASVGDLF